VKHAESLLVMALLSEVQLFFYNLKGADEHAETFYVEL
jgi:hypothetical protein